MAARIGTPSCTRVRSRITGIRSIVSCCGRTIYLNDDFDEGETGFLYQRRKIVPKTGALLIAPTAFTHTHRGNMPKRGDKYIATSWILFRRAEAMHASSAQR